MRLFKNNIFTLSIIFIILSIIFYARCGNMLIDFSRESYIPYQMLNGSKLGQDIFLIYGSFGYFLNMLLYKISVNINFLLVEALLISYLTTILFYFILKKFTSNLESMLFSLAFIIFSIFSNSNFSFSMPYSYSTIWGVFAVYAILFSYLYRYNKIIYFLLGFLAINKIELFLLTLLFCIIFDVKNKKFNYKNYLLILIIPALSVFIYNPIENLDNLIKLCNMTKTNAIKTLYRGMGTYFEINYFIYNLKYFMLYMCISIISYLIFKKNKSISFVIIALLFIFKSPNILMHLGFFAAVILTVINIKKMEQKDIILLIFCFILCSKGIFALDYYSYSNFGWCLTIFFIYIQLSKLYDKKYIIAHFSLLFASLLFLKIADYYNYPKYSINTNIGQIFLGKTDYQLTKQIIDYLDKNLQENEKLIVVPEGQIFNLIYKKPWNYNNSTFTPLDFETFGEKKLTDNLKQNKTDYIIFYPRDTKEYGAKTICYDYGIDFCQYIADNYNRKEMFGNTQKALIFKINEKK